MDGHNMSCLDLQHQNYWFQQKGVPNTRKQKPCNFFSSLEKKPNVALQKCGSRPLLLGFQVANENFPKHPPPPQSPYNIFLNKIIDSKPSFLTQCIII